MTRRFRPLVWYAAGLTMVGCVAVNATQLGTVTQRPAIPPERVAIYRTAEQVPSRYEEVALLNATGESGWTSEAGMHSGMRKKAGKLGANAIILDAMTEPSAGAKIAGALFGVGADRKGRAIAIYILPSDSIPR